MLSPESGWTQSAHEGARDAGLACACESASQKPGLCVCVCVCVCVASQNSSERGLCKVRARGGFPRALKVRESLRRGQHLMQGAAEVKAWWPRL